MVGVIMRQFFSYAEDTVVVVVIVVVLDGIPEIQKEPVRCPYDTTAPRLSEASEAAAAHS